MGLERARKAIEQAIRTFLGSTLSAAWSLAPGSLDGGECAEFCVEHENCQRAYETIIALERRIERVIRNTTGETKEVEVNHELRRTRVRICQMFREEVFEMPDKWKWATVAVTNQIRNFFQFPLINELGDVDEVIHPGCNEIFVCHEPKDIPESAWLGLEKRMEEAVYHTTGYHAHAVVMDKSNNRTWIQINVMKRETIFDRLERKGRERDRGGSGYYTPPRCGKVKNAAEAWRESAMACLAELDGTPEANAPHTFFTKRLNMDEPRWIIRDELADWTMEQSKKKTEEDKMANLMDIVKLVGKDEDIMLAVDGEEKEGTPEHLTPQMLAKHSCKQVQRIQSWEHSILLRVKE